LSAKHQFIDITLPKSVSKKDRLTIADLIIERIVERTTEGLDKKGNPFPGYSKSYINSLDFQNAGKSAGDINLQLSGDMLAALTVLKDGSDKIRIGFERGSNENARADGNIRGTYGKERGSRKKARDFLGIDPEELKSIIDMVVSE
jgi:phage gpG-like protein